jgi:2-polyprenyl-3-methyl-5-hydroxy-6-metoxy-1,4-benzoquinol methylase
LVTIRKKTVEPQYQPLIDIESGIGLAKLGLMSNQVWHDDPKRLAFMLARYKFVSRILEGKREVLEIGCGDAFASRIVQQAVGSLTVADFDPLFIRDIDDRNIDKKWKLKTIVHDMLSGPIDKNFDGIYLMDVLEHIQPSDENSFILNILSSLAPSGVVVIGAPSLESQVYASTQSKEGHVNCKTGSKFKSDLEKYFLNVFLFSMNDEVVHTGFMPMAHYLIAVCTQKKSI